MQPHTDHTRLMSALDTRNGRYGTAHITRGQRANARVDPAAGAPPTALHHAVGERAGSAGVVLRHSLKTFARDGADNVDDAHMGLWR